MIRLMGVILIFLITGCGNRGSFVSDGNGAVDSSKVNLAAKREKLSKAQVLYIRNCAECHGWDGKDSGPAAKVLGISPPSLRRKSLFSMHSEEDLIARVTFGRLLSVCGDAPKKCSTYC